MQASYVVFVLVITLVLLLLARMRAELVAIMVLIALEIPGILTRDEALAGFSNSAVITVMGLYVIGAALERTGVADTMATVIIRLGGTTERRLIALVMGVTALLSLVMNNVAAGAVVLPAAVTVARRVRLAPARLLMPMAFGAALGGMATIFTTANILISATLRSAGLHPLSFFDFFPLGAVLVVAGITYMLLVGRRFLPATDPHATVAASAALPDIYDLPSRLWEATVPPSSPLVGATLGRINVGDRFGVTVVATFHGQDANLTPDAATILHGGDVLLIAGHERQILAIPGVTIGRETRSSGYFTDPHVQTAEIVVAPRSAMLGRTLKDLGFRRRYGLTVIAVWQGERAYRTHIGDLRLQAGDALLVVGTPDRLAQIRENPSWIVLTPLTEPRTQARPGKRRLAVGITGLVLGLATAQWIPTSIAVLAGLVLLVLTECLSMDEALAAIEWKTILVIAGMVPLSVAMQKTGVAASMAQGIARTVGSYGPLPLVGVLYLATVALTQILGGQITALVMGPVAVATATAAGMPPRAVGIAVAMACSASFLTPLAHPVNVLTLGPAGYTFRDFARVGVGLVVLCTVIILAGLPLIGG